MKEKTVQGTLFPELEVNTQEPQRVCAFKKTTIEALQEKIAELEKEKESLMAENESLREKADGFDALANSSSLFTPTIIAKTFGRSAIWLNKYLEQKNVQFFNGEAWILYAPYQNKGYTRICYYNYHETKGGKALEKPHTYWTGKGLIFIRSLLKKDGII